MENVRAALQRNQGTSFHFWKPEKSLYPLHERALELLAQVDLQDFAHELTVNLPYGRKRALELATTMALEPELMLLDEPTQGMGHEDVHRVTQLIKKVSPGPHDPDGGAQHERRVLHRRPHHGCCSAARSSPTARMRRCRRTRR
jgi:ABC-type branched-subunit amino acid transport system ATPase component